MSGLRRLLLSLSLVTALVLAATPAYAETWRHTDAVGDVIVSDSYRDSPPTGPEIDPTERRSDITRVNVLHTADVVRVVVAVRAQDIRYISLSVRVVTSRGDAYSVNVGISAEPYFSIFRNGYRYRCDGVTANRTRAGFVMSAPRSCLDDPYRVRIGVQVDGGSFGVDHERTFEDDYLRTGRFDGAKPKLGSWVVGEAAA